MGVDTAYIFSLCLAQSDEHNTHAGLENVQEEQMDLTQTLTDYLMQ